MKRVRHIRKDLPAVGIDPADRGWLPTSVAGGWWIGGFATEGAAVTLNPTFVPDQPDGEITITGHFHLAHGATRLEALANGYVDYSAGPFVHFQARAIDTFDWVNIALDILNAEIIAAGVGITGVAGHGFASGPGIHGWGWDVDDGATVDVYDDHLIAGDMNVGKPSTIIIKHQRTIRSDHAASTA
jgi:hypothetical protein